jgi:RsiW-degrading membrane proteinase PrsW (M82 family)
MVARWLAPFLLLSLLLSLVGCGEHLAGTHDAKLELTIKAPAKPKLRDAHAPKPSWGKAPTAAEEAALPITLRLATMHITADVIPIGADKLELRLDQDEVEAAKDLLAWRGGVELDELDPAFPVTLASTKGLTEKTESHDGVTETYWEGPRDMLAIAVFATKVPEGHALLAQAYDSKRGRTRVVKKPALADLSDAVDDIGRKRSGKALELVIHPDAQGRIDDAVTKSGGKPVAVVRASSVLAVQPIAKGTRTFELDFGDDIYSYTRAHTVQKALLTPPTPLVEASEPQALPPDWAMAIASIVLPIFLSMMWLVFVRRFDRAHPEPWWLVLVTFGLGGLSVIPAGFAEYVMQRASPYLSPEVMTFGGQLLGFFPALVVFTVVVGLSEEGSKFLGAWSLARHRREFDEPIDGMVYGSASALGFAAVENVKYFAVGRLGGTLIVARLFMSVPGHMFFGALWGYALGQKLVRKKTPVWAYLLLAAFLHGAFDTMLSIDGTAIGAMIENLVLAGLFVLLLRRSLRHGAVEKGAGDAPLSTQRWLFSVGSPWLFAIYVVGFHLAAFVCFGVGIYFEVAHHRIGIVFIYVCAALVSLIGFIGYGISQTMPLDVAVDAVGITFAGAARKWGRITAIERFTTWGVVGPRHKVRVRSPDGDLVIGPASQARVEELGARLTTARAGVPATG